VTTFECTHESDVVLAVQTGRWPARVDETLRRHVEGCSICTDAITIAAAIAESTAEDDHAQAGPVPGAGAMWLRMQMRARADAARAANRTLTITQVAAVGAAAAAGGAVFGATSGWFRSFIGRAWSAVASGLGTLSIPSSVATVVGEHLLLAVILLAIVIATPVAVLLVERQR
jgi:hypothetical protein